jgi:excisionase family DNA binding protein
MLEQRELIREQLELIQEQENKCNVHMDNFRDRYLNIEEAAAYLNVPKSWIYQNHKLKRIPYYKLQRKLLFKADELDSWISTFRS